MREYLKHNPVDRDNLDKAEARRLLARLRQDQLEAALAGRIDESAFFAGEARALRAEIEQADEADPDRACAGCA